MSATIGGGADVRPAAGGRHAFGGGPAAVRGAHAAADSGALGAHPSHAGHADKGAHAAPLSQRMARFSHLYESRDGALCLFQDEFGHLQAVDSSRLA